MEFLIRQRNNSDCAVCTLAMALGVPYEDVFEMLPEYQKNLAAGKQQGLSVPDYLYVMQTYGFSIESVYPGTVNKWYGDDFWEYLKHKLAFLVVNSLNYPGRLHSVFWDGEGVRDPSEKCAYTDETVKENGAVKYALVIEPIIPGIDNS